MPKDDLGLLDFFDEDASDVLEPVKRPAPPRRAPVPVYAGAPEAEERPAIDWTTWGSFSKTEKERLDKIYATLAAGYAGVSDPRVLFNLQKAAVINLKYMQALDAGDEKKAKSFSDQIKTLFDMEGMKASDQKPLARMRVDGLAQRLEQKGMMRDGVMLLKGVVDYIRNDFGRYDMSRDAVDVCMLKIINAMRGNNGLSDLTELSEDMTVEDKYGELLPNPTNREREAMIEFGDMPMGHGGGLV